MAGKIFINYRRGDAPDSTGRLYDRLEQEFAAADIFMDVEGHIKPGDDFVDVLNSQVAQCDVLLAIIGPHWNALLAARANDPDDFVAIEIKAALHSGKRVIPVLVGGAMMPKADSLPPSIQALARRNAVGLRPERFKADCQGIVSALKEQLAAAEAERNARTEAERAAAEAARRKADEEAAARAKEAEQRGRDQAQAGLSPDQISKAEELANWEFIKDSSEPQEFRDHLARFPKGVVERNARGKLEALLWAAIVKAPDDANKGTQIANFLTEFPDGKFAGEAKALNAKAAARARQAADQLAQLNAERDAWAEAAQVNTLTAYRDFLKAWPDGANADAAKARIKELRSSAGIIKGGIPALAVSVFTIGAIGLGLSTLAPKFIPNFGLQLNRSPKLDKSPQPPPPPLSVNDAEAAFSKVNDFIRSKRIDFNKVVVKGGLQENADGTYHYRLDAPCGKDQRGIPALRGMALAFSLYEASAMAVEGDNIENFTTDGQFYPSSRLRELFAKLDKANAVELVSTLKLKLKNYLSASGDIKAFLKELLQYKSKFQSRDISIDWKKSNFDYRSIAETVGDPKSEKPCFNGSKFLVVGNEKDDGAGLYGGYGTGSPHGYFYSFWYRRKTEGTTEIADAILNQLVAE